MKDGVAVVKSVASRACPRPGARVAFDTISSPGAYVCDWSGHLLRIPDRAVTPARCPGLNIVGREPLTVTKISDDPEVPLAQARGLAAEYGVAAGF
jgi:hypothetical protein